MGTSVRLTILHTNDLHGKLTQTSAAFLRSFKEASSPCLMLDSGDCIKAGNLAVPVREEAAWALLQGAGCDAGTLGNRETHPLEPAMRAKLKGARHPLLCANLRLKNGSRPLPSNARFEFEGFRVGVFGVMVPMVTERMKTAFASAYLWDPPIASARDQAALLRNDVDLLIALSHIGIQQDRKLAEACPEIDLILGGHSHTVLDQPERIGSVSICQGGSHGRYVGRYVWEAGAGLTESSLIGLPNP